jgi:hypothetical protein
MLLPVCGLGRAAHTRLLLRGAHHTSRLRHRAVHERQNAVADRTDGKRCAARTDSTLHCLTIGHRNTPIGALIIKLSLS